VNRSLTTSRAEPITRDDIKAKLAEIQDGALHRVESARTQAIRVGIVVAVVVVAGVYLLGRRGGRRRQTIVEIKSL
jgi:hypothetical protein